METPQSIHMFWFGPEEDPGIVARQQQRLWWEKDPQFDRQIEERFAPALAALERGELDAWSGSAAGTLALILLSDQFPRNMFRDTPRAFAYDERALRWCRQGLARDLPASLRPIERVFFYMPLEHAESLAAQEQAVALFEELLGAVEPAQRPVFENFLDFAQRHHDIIRQFGRFPHRNALLGRPSTEAEEAFLQQPGSSF